MPRLRVSPWAVVGQVQAAAAAHGRTSRRSRLPAPRSGAAPTWSRKRPQRCADAGAGQASAAACSSGRSGRQLRRRGSRAAATAACQARLERRPVVRSALHRRHRARPGDAGGNSPVGRPLPSQLSRLTRRRRSAGVDDAVGGLPLAQRVEVLDRHRHRAAGGLAERPGAAHARARRRSRGCSRRQLLERVRLLGVRRRDDVALVVLGDREQPVHRRRSASPVMPTAAGIDSSRLAAEVDVAHVRAHRGEPCAARASTGAASPAVNSSARYSTGMRSASMAPNRLPRVLGVVAGVAQRRRRPATAAGCTRPSAWCGTPGAAAARPGNCLVSA